MSALAVAFTRANLSRYSSARRLPWRRKLSCFVFLSTLHSPRPILALPISSSIFTAAASDLSLPDSNWLPSGTPDQEPFPAIKSAGSNFLELSETPFEPYTKIIFPESPRALKWRLSTAKKADNSAEEGTSTPTIVSNPLVDTINSTHLAGINDTMTFTPLEKVTRLREQMAKFNLDAYVVPTADAHDSEYVVAADARREYISGFTGSAGVAVISKDSARLWTDGRYHLQAEKQLSADVWTLMKSGVTDVPEIPEWIKKEQLARVGFDPYITTNASLKRLESGVDSNVTRFIPVHAGSRSNETETEDLKIMKGVAEGQDNLVDRVWEADGIRPNYPSNSIIQMTDTVAGESVASKLKRLREAATKQKAGVMVVAALDDIAWLFNLRGQDCEFAKLFLSYAVITKDNAHLYIKNVDAENRLDSDVRKALQENNIDLHPYEEIGQGIVSAVSSLQNETVWIDSSVNTALATVASVSVPPSVSENEELTPIRTDVPIKHYKALKNAAELNGMIQSHVEDGAALSMYLAWLQSLSPEEIVTYDEYTAAEKLESFRAIQPDFISISFSSISGVDDNGAIIHYRPRPGESKQLHANAMYLIDSGGHYTGGTTDVTRTIHLGTPSAWQKEIYTRVLMGHVDLSMVKFGSKTYGSQFDLLARQALFEIGMDYMHGTGHGVGHRLIVHEHPPTIVMKPGHPWDKIFEAGMVVSNEPGCYIDGQFGVRIENMQYVRENIVPRKFNNQTYLEFNQLTLTPYDPRLIDTSLLNSKQVKYINEYHSRCHSTLTSYINNLGRLSEVDRRRTLAWLDHVCQPLL